MDPVVVEQRLAELAARVKRLEQSLPKPVPVVEPIVAGDRATSGGGSGARGDQHAPTPDYGTEEAGGVSVYEWKRRALDAEAELKRLGHGEEVIFVFAGRDEPMFTSHVGDCCWDTRDNRRKTFAFIERTLARARVATEKP